MGFYNENDAEGVTSINGLFGDIILAAGTNITLVPVGNTITINATGGSGGVTTIGAFGGSLTNGLNITGSTLTLGAADATNPGGVATVAQTFGGLKTFASGVAVGLAGETAGANQNIYSTLGAENFTNFFNTSWTIATPPWTALTGSSTQLDKSGNGTTAAIFDGFSPTVGVVYKVSYTVGANTASTGASATFGGLSINGFTTAQTGVITTYVRAFNTNKLNINPLASASRFTITAVSIKALDSSVGNETVYGDLFVGGGFKSLSGNVGFSIDPNGAVRMPSISGNVAFSGALSGISTLGTTGAISTINTNIQATSTDGLVANNNTSATVGQQVQMSPRLRLSGRGWKTDTTPTVAGSQNVDFIVETLPITGTSVVTGTLNFSSQVNGLGYNERMRLTDTGTLALGTASPAASAIFDATSTAKGLLIPRMTTTQKNAIASPASALLVYDTTLRNFYYYDSAWLPVISNATSGVLAVNAATTGVLPNTPTYANGASGVGATLTAGSNTTLAAQDGVTLGLNDRLLVKNQAAAEQNGPYQLSQVGSGSLPWILTRTTDADTTAEMDPQIVSPSGGTLAGVLFAQTTANPVIGNAVTGLINYSTTTGTGVTQATSGTQSNNNVAFWTGNPRELSKGIAMGGANTILGVNNGATAHEYKTFSTIGTTGTAPAWSLASSGLIILNIPFASAGVGVTAGLLSNTDYAAFDAKIDGTTTDTQVSYGSSTGSTITSNAAFTYNVPDDRFTIASAFINTDGIFFNGASAPNGLGNHAGIGIDMKTPNLAYTFGDVGINNNTHILVDDANQDYTFSKLAGSGTRMVTADANGVLGTTTLPAGTIGGAISTNQVAFGTGTDTIGGDNDFTYDGTNMAFGGGTATFGSNFVIGSTGDLTISTANFTINAATGAFAGANGGFNVLASGDVWITGKIQDSSGSHFDSFDPNARTLNNNAGGTEMVWASPGVVNVNNLLTTNNFGGNGPAPSCSGGNATSASVTAGNDLGGTLEIIAGVLTGSGVVTQITFNTAYASTPRAVLLFPQDDNSATSLNAGLYSAGNFSTTGFDIRASSLTGSGTFTFSYIVIQ